MPRSLRACCVPYRSLLLRSRRRVLFAWMPRQGTRSTRSIRIALLEVRRRCLVAHWDRQGLIRRISFRSRLSAGWGTISYRNNSELRMAAWHWTENGTWSDPVHKKRLLHRKHGTRGADPRYILSYDLPHRGFTASGGFCGEDSKPHLLEEQPIFGQQTHRGIRCACIRNG